MKICVPIEIKPEGGGNYFLQNFLRYLDQRGIPHTHEITDRYEVLFTSHWLVHPRLVRRGLARNPALRLVHRIDGAARDYGRDPRVDALQHEINRMADLTIFQSRYCRFSTREKFPVIVHDGPVIYNPVDTEQFRPDGPRRQFPETIRLCCVTWSMNPKKGAQTMYDVALANPDLGFILCGRFPDAPQRPHIHALGVLDRDELAAVMRSCDALVTFAENEACPNVVLEGLASGLPILYRDSGAAPELVGDCGLAVEPAHFREQLQRIMREHETLSQRARQRALTAFAPQVAFGRYIEEVERTLKRPPTEKRRPWLGWRPTPETAPAHSGAPRLAVFLTRDISLAQWDRRGMLEREIAIYRKLRPHLGGLALVTYGDADDLRYQPALEQITILCNRWRLPRWLYRPLIPFLHWRHLAQADIFKTNQINGSEAALWARRIHRRARLIARCGYLWSLNAHRAAGNRRSREHWLATRRERVAFRCADHVVVTTDAGKRYVEEHYHAPADRVRVIPNYVQTDLFAGVQRTPSGLRRLLFVGRLHPEKNLSALVTAVAGLNVELALIGEGPQRTALEREARRQQTRVTLLGSRPHHELADQFARATLFILPSLYENHPKALLEAMAAGLPVIGTDVPGIRELIDHRRTGYLCGTSAAELRQAIVTVLDNSTLQAAMGRNARHWVTSRFALERVAQQELALLRELCPSDVPVQRTAALIASTPTQPPALAGHRP